jgi:hypothetical protein
MTPRWRLAGLGFAAWAFLATMGASESNTYGKLNAALGGALSALFYYGLVYVAFRIAQRVRAGRDPATPEPAPANANVDELSAAHKERVLGGSPPGRWFCDAFGHRWRRAAAWSGMVFLCALCAATTDRPASADSGETADSMSLAWGWRNLAWSGFVALALAGAVGFGIAQRWSFEQWQPVDQLVVLLGGALSWRVWVEREVNGIPSVAATMLATPPVLFALGLILFYWNGATWRLVDQVSVVGFVFAGVILLGVAARRQMHPPPLGTARTR